MKLSKTITRKLFSDHLKGRNLSTATVNGYIQQCGQFFRWLLAERNKNDAHEVTGDDILGYRLYLAEAKDDDGNPRYAEESKAVMMRSVKALFRFLSKNEYILLNPFDGLDLKAYRHGTIREDVPEAKINRFLDAIPSETPRDMRDRAIFELMYGTGLRIGEVSRLDVMDVDLNNGRLMVREGKGRKDRIVPLGDHVSRHLEIYLKVSREEFLTDTSRKCDVDALFLNAFGGRMRIDTIRDALYGRCEEFQSGAEKIKPHQIRHSFATHVLRHGAGIKHVKEILGHKSIQSTVVYTHFSEASLKRIMKMYHPRENELFEELTDEDRRRLRALPGPCSTGVRP